MMKEKGRVKGKKEKGREAGDMAREGRQMEREKRKGRKTPKEEARGKDGGGRII